MLLRQLITLVTLSTSCQYVLAQTTAATSDPAISYVGDWALTAGLASHIASQPGSTATFTFSGTSVKWRSTRSSRQGVEQVTLDGKQYMVDTTWADESMSWQTVVVFEQDNLPAGQHTLVITKKSAVSQVAVVWDFIYDSLIPTYVPGSGNSQTSQAPAPVSSTSSVARPLPASSSSSSLTSSPSASSSSNSISSPSSSSSSTSILSQNSAAVSSSSDSAGVAVSSAVSSVPSPSNLPGSSQGVVTGTAFSNSASGTASSATLATTTATDYVAGSSNSAEAFNSPAPGGSTSSTPNEPDDDDGKKSSGPNGLTIGLSVAAAVLAIVLFGLLWLFCIRRKRRDAREGSMMAEGTNGGAGRSWREFGGDNSVRSVPLTPISPLSGTLSVPTPAQEYASLAMQSPNTPRRPNTPSIMEEPSGTYMSEATGRRERPPTYVSTHPRLQGTGQRPQDLAVFVDMGSSASIYGDLTKKRPQSF